MLHVVDRGWTSTKQKSGLRSAEWTGYSHLGPLTSALTFLITMTVVGNSPFGSGGSVLLSLSLSPCVCLLTLLPGHCAHSLSVTISSKLHEAHYSHIPPGGVGARQHLHREAQTLYGWLAEDRNLSAPPLCALFFSSLPFPLIFLLYSEKGWIKDDISATGQEVRSHVSRSLNQPWEPGWLLSVKLCQLTTGCWRL